MAFPNETKVNLWNLDGIQFYWKRPGDPIMPHHIHPTIQQGGGHLMFWGCMTWRGLGYGCQIHDGTLNAVDYIEILKTTLQDTLEYYGYDHDDFVLQ
jgi:hypothetical protein